MAIIVIGKSPALEYRWVLRAGQRARVGHSPWAEFCIEDDDQLREFHCELAIDNDDSPRLIAIDDAEMEVQPSWTALAYAREELRVVVGGSQLSLLRERRQRPDFEPTRATAISSVEDTCDVHAQPSAELLHGIGLSELAVRVVDQQRLATESPSHCARALLSHDLVEDALRYVTACIQVPERLRWCYEVMHRAGQAPPNSAAALVHAWLAEPRESLRQAIAVHVDWNRKQDPITWFMASIAWTGGNLASGNSISIPPTDQMIISGVMTALGITGAQVDIVAFQREAAELGLEWLDHPSHFADQKRG